MRAFVLRQQANWKIISEYYFHMEKSKNKKAASNSQLATGDLIFSILPFHFIRYA